MHLVRRRNPLAAGCLLTGATVRIKGLLFGFLGFELVRIAFAFVRSMAFWSSLLGEVIFIES